MTRPVIVELAVAPTAGPGTVSLAQADEITALAQRLGATAVRLVDRGPGGQAIDPTVVGSYLAGRSGDIGYLADVPTTGQAPYNLARRILSADRATAGRFGVVLRAGHGDEVSQATAPDPAASGPIARWSEYARVLTRLWESFPRAALLGDVENALVVNDSLIRPIAHTGRFYRVAGPLDGPSSVQGRPVLAATDPELLDEATAVADLIIVGRDQAAGADRALTSALARAGRDRSQVALMGRVVLPAGPHGDPGRPDLADPAALRTWITGTGLDGVVLAPTGPAEQIADLLTTLVPALHPARGDTLRAGLGLPAPAPVEVAA
jgi:alkanesulfonate monooxygenase SsuD/methylene tetrahydromethanopterin reductase-like flavin-dependent oxidoreductase (luciferase family)